MTALEFSNEFDVLYNNVLSDRAPGLSEYEKSVFLTKAQELLVVEMYNGFIEKNEEYRRSLENLIDTKYLYPVDEDDYDLSLLPVEKFHQTVFRLPEDLMYVIYEAARFDDRLACNDGTYVAVIPETHDDLHKDLKNPFRGPTMARVLRLDNGKLDADSTVELISKYNLDKYVIRYVRRPYPIILEPLENGLTINSQNVPLNEFGMCCELDVQTHNKILVNAVSIAQAAYIGVDRSQVQNQSNE